MKIRIIKFGKPAFTQYRALVETYIERMQAFHPVELVELKAKPENETDVEKLWTQITLKQSPTEHIVVCLDERGRQYKSPELAAKIATWRDNPAIKNLSFVVGGPYGIPTALREKTQLNWAISDCVTTSDLCWLFVTEQLYRAFNILAGTSYHHE